MIRNLLVQDYSLHQIMSILGVLALITMMREFSQGGIGFNNNDMLVRVLPWGVFIVWSQLTAHEGWKVLIDEDLISKKILQRNRTHLSISGDTIFA